MFCFEVLGYYFNSDKGFFVLHIAGDMPGVKGKAVDQVFVYANRIEGGKIDIGSLVKVYRDAKGYVQGVEVI